MYTFDSTQLFYDGQVGRSLLDCMWQNETANPSSDEDIHRVIDVEKFLIIIGWTIIILGAIAGLVAWGSQPVDQTGNYTGLIIFILGGISGIIFLAIGRIIDVLEGIKEHTRIMSQREYDINPTILHDKYVIRD